MLWLKQAKAKLKGVDEFYVDLNLNQIGIYQRIFDSLLASIDIDTETAWSKGEKYDKVRFEKDEKTINPYCELAEQRGCNPAYLLIMFQSIHLCRSVAERMGRKQWAKRVVRRKELDYFPSGWAMHALLERMS